MQQPWKMFIRSVSVVTVLTAGGFAAGQSVLPFTHVNRVESPTVSEDDPSLDTDTPTVDPVDVVEDTTTTTEAPEVEAPEVDDVEVPEADAPDAAESDDDDSATTTTTKPAPVKVTEVPAAPKAHAEKEKGDHNCDGHFDNGWANKSEEWVDAHAEHGGCAMDKPAAAEKDHGRPDAAPAGDDDHGRPDAAPAQAKNGDRPESAPGHTKHAE